MAFPDFEYSTIDVTRQYENRVYPYMITGNDLEENSYQSAMVFDTEYEAMNYFDLRQFSNGLWEGLHVYKGDFLVYEIEGDSIIHFHKKFSVTDYTEVTMSDREKFEFIFTRLDNSKEDIEFRKSIDNKIKGIVRNTRGNGKTYDQRLTDAQMIILNEIK